MYKRQLVEDLTDDYLLAAEGTITPTPVSFNEVRSPEELVREVRSGHALTYVQARSVDNIFNDGCLLYTSGSINGTIAQWRRSTRTMIWITT